MFDACFLVRERNCAEKIWHEQRKFIRDSPPFEGDHYKNMVIATFR